MSSANSAEDIPQPLYDRMEVIEVPSYTLEEKIQIAKRHLLPRQLEQHGLTRKELRLTDGALNGIIDGYTREAECLCEKSVRLLAGDLEKTGALHEYYNPLTGEPVMNGGFINWNILALNMIQELYAARK